MIKSKKGGGTGEVFMQIIGLIAAVVLFLVLFNSCSNNAAKFFETKKTNVQFVEALTDVGQNYQVGGSKSFELKMDEESAIIGFNPGKNFVTNRRGLPFPPKATRPDDCEDDKTCVCGCSGFSIESSVSSGSNIVCEQMDCISTDAFVFAGKHLMGAVFDNIEADGQGLYTAKDKKEFYWENGIILLRHPKYSMQNLQSATSPLGPAETTVIEIYNNAILPVVIKNEGKNTVKLCLKEECWNIKEVVPVNCPKCSEFKTESLCNSINNVPGCSILQSCQWENNLCVEKP